MYKCLVLYKFRELNKLVGHLNSFHYKLIIHNLFQYILLNKYKCLVLYKNRGMNILLDLLNFFHHKHLSYNLDLCVQQYIDMSLEQYMILFLNKQLNQLMVFRNIDLIHIELLYIQLNIDKCQVQDKIHERYKLEDL